MIPFVRRADGVHLTLSSGERAVLDSLTTQLIQILGDGLAADPAVTRLFPQAYRDDPEASAEFRRYTLDDLQAQKAANARMVHDRLTGAVSGPFDREAEQAWLRCLTDLRLIIAERLGIADSDPEDVDPEETESDGASSAGVGLRDVYDWLGFIQEHLIDTLQGR